MIGRRVANIIKRFACDCDDMRLATILITAESQQNAFGVGGKAKALWQIRRKTEQFYGLVAAGKAN